MLPMAVVAAALLPGTSLTRRAVLATPAAGLMSAALRDRSAGLAQPSRRVRATLNVFAGRKDNGRDTFGSGRLFGRDTTIDPSGSGSRMTCSKVGTGRKTAAVILCI